MEFVSTAFNKFGSIHPLLKVGIGACSALLLRQIGAKISRKLYQQPDGPEGYPVVGIIPYLLSSSPINLFAYTLSTYGPITCFSLGLKKVVLINDPYLAKKIMSNPLTLDKQQRGSTHANPVGLLNGNKWKQRRKTVHIHMINVLKTAFLENGIKKVFKEMISNILDQHSQNGVKLDLQSILQPLTFNIMFYASFGTYLKSLDDPFWNQLNKKIKSHTSNTMTRMMKSMIYGENGWIDNEWNDILIFIKDYIDRNIDENTKNNVDCIYYKLCNNKDNDMNELDVISEILGLFIGATEATSTTMHFVILLLSKYPDVQTMIYKELNIIKTICSDDNNDKNEPGIDLNANNISKVPYFRSMIHETLRLYPPTIGTSPRTINKSFVVDNVQSICGRVKSYKIPKGCLLQVNTIGIARTAKYWTDKDESEVNMDGLNLDFWINDEGKFVMNKDSFTTFSIGKRDCVGRALALKLIYIVMSCLMLDYEFYVKDVDSFKIEGKVVKGPMMPIYSQPVFVRKR